MRKYDLVIIGGGPAGLTAGVYAARARLSTLLLEKGLFGGQIVNAELVENYPGFPEGISGFELGEAMHRQAVKHGVESLSAEATAIESRQGEKLVRTAEDELTARAVIIAAGSEHQKLGVPGEETLLGKGVSYCATCDAAFFREKVVAVVGGGDVALTEALHLTKFASRVVLIHRRSQLRASKALQERAFASPAMQFLWDTVVESVAGQGVVEYLKLRQVKTRETSSLKVDGVFVAIGFRPNTDFLRGLLQLDEGNHVITNQRMETELPGIFAAGDIRHDSARQAIAAAGDGATAALVAQRYIEEHR